MGNELQTIGGAAATVVTSVAAGVTFGQVDKVNEAVKDTAKFTAKAASKTIVRHVGETTASALGTAGVAVASGITFGQVGTLNKTVKKLAKHTGQSFLDSTKSVGNTLNGLATGTPVVGHVKGVVHYAMKDKEKGDIAMKSASRTTSVMIGGIIGSLGGPVGMVGGGIAGGAVIDSITTGIESAKEKRLVPFGQINAWVNVHKARKNKDPQAILAGVLDAIITVAGDALSGYTAGKNFLKIKAKIAKRANAAVDLPDSKNIQQGGESALDFADADLGTESVSESRFSLETCEFDEFSLDLGDLDLADVDLAAESVSDTSFILETYELDGFSPDFAEVDLPSEYVTFEVDLDVDLSAKSAGKSSSSAGASANLKTSPFLPGLASSKILHMIINKRYADILDMLTNKLVNVDPRTVMKVLRKLHKLLKGHLEKEEGHKRKDTTDDTMKVIQRFDNIFERLLTDDICYKHVIKVLITEFKSLV